MNLFVVGVIAGIIVAAIVIAFLWSTSKGSREAKHDQD